MAKAFGPERVFDPTDATRIRPEGVVIIDEVDAHLHPTWQQRIGRWFCEHFPNVQFIVSTHSPLVCQSAENGSIYVLPRSGTDERGGMVKGADLKRLVYGTVLDAYGTEAFGREAALTRSPSSRDMHRRLATLNNTEIRRRLTADEEKERQELREAPAVCGTDSELTVLKIRNGRLPSSAAEQVGRVPTGRRRAKQPIRSESATRRKSSKPTTRRGTRPLRRGTDETRGNVRWNTAMHVL